MKYLVFDFETTGLDKDADNKYRPYPTDLKPLPREDYPVQLAAALLDDSGAVEKQMCVLLAGAERMSPWVQTNCPHLSVKDCERDGIDLAEALKQMADMASPECTLVAHNLSYDWDKVLVRTVRERHLEDHPAYLSLKDLPRWCTMVNPGTKKNGSAYFWKKVGDWIGPRLQVLAQTYGVPYDPKTAHDAAYDVEVTAACLCHQMKLVPCQ